MTNKLQERIRLKRLAEARGSTIEVEYEREFGKPMRPATLADRVADAAISAAEEGLDTEAAVERIMTAGVEPVAQQEKRTEMARSDYDHRETRIDRAARDVMRQAPAREDVSAVDATRQMLDTIRPDRERYTPAPATPQETMSGLGARSTTIGGAYRAERERRASGLPDEASRPTMRPEVQAVFDDTAEESDAAMDYLAGKEPERFDQAADRYLRDDEPNPDPAPDPAPEAEPAGGLPNPEAPPVPDVERRPPANVPTPAEYVPTAVAHDLAIAAAEAAAEVDAPVSPENRDPALIALIALIGEPRAGRPPDHVKPLKELSRLGFYLYAPATRSAVASDPVLTIGKDRLYITRAVLDHLGSKTEAVLICRGVDHAPNGMLTAALAIVAVPKGMAGASTLPKDKRAIGSAPMARELVAGPWERARYRVELREGYAVAFCTGKLGGN